MDLFILERNRGAWFPYSRLATPFSVSERIRIYRLNINLKSIRIRWRVTLVTAAPTGYRTKPVGCLFRPRRYRVSIMRRTRRKPGVGCRRERTDVSSETRVTFRSIRARIRWKYRLKEPAGYRIPGSRWAGVREGCPGRCNGF